MALIMTTYRNLPLERVWKHDMEINERDKKQEQPIPEDKKSDYLWILQNRIFRIFNVVTQYGEDKFYISFSGGKDSTVLSALVDMAIPGNKIPRVYANTGIEYDMIRKFVESKAEVDDRFVIIKPKVPIKKMLEEEGYPFKSKEHSVYVKKYQRGGLNYKSDRAYTQLEPTLSGRPIMRACPRILMYQFTDENKLKISDACCERMKEKPMETWSKENGRPYHISGIMREEDGRRKQSQCLAFHGGKIAFNPLVQITKDWEEWFIEKYDIEICDLYKPPYNFRRTGCKGCPFALRPQEELDTIEKFFPNERKQCEIIWKPVYDEYRRLGYRLRKEYHEEQDEQLFFCDADFCE